MCFGEHIPDNTDLVLIDMCTCPTCFSALMPVPLLIFAAINDELCVVSCGGKARHV